MNGSTLGVLGPVLQICLIDLLLSGDNALVIALACRGLPARLWLRAVLLGTSAAIVLRIALTALATLILDLPYLKLVGAVLLVAIAVKLLAEDPASRPPLDDSQQQHDMWKAVWTIIVADTVMSLDNVVAVAAASRGSIALLAFGLLLSIPLLILGSAVVTRVMDRYPVVIQAGGALLGWVAGATAVSDPAIKSWAQSQPFGLAATAPLLVAIYVLVQGRIARLWRRRSAKGARP
jgi:YjbE family integral membrane protein